MKRYQSNSLIRKVDCVRIHVPDLESGLAFYRDQLGHELIWLTERAIGLRMSESDTEIVLQTEDDWQETDLKVDSADAAAVRIEKAGGSVIVPPFDIQIGRCVVVEDPWGNRLVLLDTTRGLLVTNDDDGNVIGNVSQVSAQCFTTFPKLLQNACGIWRKLTQPTAAMGLRVSNGFGRFLPRPGVS